MGPLPLQLIKRSKTDWPTGEFARIRYECLNSPFGEILIASTDEGICFLGFTDSVDLDTLKAAFPQSELIESTVTWHQYVVRTWAAEQNEGTGLTGTDGAIPLHLFGTDFQHRVWEALLHVPLGQTSTYEDIASRIGLTNGSRAVGNAVGANPIAVLIPCHRILRKDGRLGGYRWKTERKVQLLGWEARA